MRLHAAEFLVSTDGEKQVAVFADPLRRCLRTLDAEGPVAVPGSATAARDFLLPDGGVDVVAMPIGDDPAAHVQQPGFLAEFAAALHGAGVPLDLARVPETLPPDIVELSNNAAAEYSAAVAEAAAEAAPERERGWGWEDFMRACVVPPGSDSAATTAVPLGQERAQAVWMQEAYRPPRDGGRGRGRGGSFEGRGRGRGRDGRGRGRDGRGRGRFDSSRSSFGGRFESEDGGGRGRGGSGRGGYSSDDGGRGRGRGGGRGGRGRSGGRGRGRGRF